MKKFRLSVLAIPLLIMLVLGITITLFPESSITVISTIRTFINNNISIWYTVFGIAAIALVIYLAFSKIGRIKLGDKKKMNTFTWGSLIFTSTMAADILFYSLHEWMYYWDADISQITSNSTTSSKILWSETYSLFHWGFIPWSFYLILAAIYGYWFYKKHKTFNNSLSSMCEPVLKSQTNKTLGKSIDVISIVGLLCGTSTTFSVTTPLMTELVCKLLNITSSPVISISILMIVAIIYTIAVLIGSKGINVVAKLTTIFFALLLSTFFIVGNPQFIIENGVQSIGNMLQHFIQLSTWTDPSRTSGFVQDWTTFYCAYWIAWCIATPFFIAKISHGRTIKETLLGGMTCGLLGTFASFIIFSGYGLNLQSNGSFDAITMLNEGINPALIIIEMISTSNISSFIYIILLISMICLYSSTFDALTDVVSSFSYKSLDMINETPSKKIKLFWSSIFLILPIALLFLDTTNQLLMSIAIIGALPLTIIMILIVISFFKDLKGVKQNEK